MHPRGWRVSNVRKQRAVVVRLGLPPERILLMARERTVLSSSVRERVACAVDMDSHVNIRDFCR